MIATVTRLPAAAIGLLLVLGLAALDAHWDDVRIITATVVIGPFVAALAASTWPTVFVGVAAVTVALLAGSWNNNFGSADYLVRLAVVTAGAAFAVMTARSLERLALDRLRFGLLRRAAEIS